MTDKEILKEIRKAAPQLNKWAAQRILEDFVCQAITGQYVKGIPKPTTPQEVHRRVKDFLNQVAAEHKKLMARHKIPQCTPEELLNESADELRAEASMS